MSQVHRLKGKKKLFHRFAIVLFCIWILLPIFWLGIMSITPQRYIAGTRYPAMLPVEPSLDAYKALLIPGSIDADQISSEVERPLRLFRRSIINSTIIASISAVLGVLLGVTTAYSLCRFKFFGKRFTYILILGSRLIAAISLAIPLFSLFRDWGILDSYLPLIFLYVVFNMCWATLIMQNYFAMLPEQLEEAALIDGCSRFSAFVRVVIPAAAPGIVSVLIITFLFSWGEFLYALLFTMSDAARTIPIALSMFIGEHEVAYRLLAASLLLSVIPPVTMAIIFQKYIISGLTASAVKG